MKKISNYHIDNLILIPLKEFQKIGYIFKEGFSITKGQYTKRITQGKGAYSLYIPKKWIEKWKDEQSKERNVNLLLLDDYLIISPVHKVSSISSRTSSQSVDDVKRFLLSSYVRGFESAELIAEDRFSDEQIMGARDFMRFLDERISLSADEKRIVFSRSIALTSIPSSALQMRALIFDKLTDAIKLTIELIEYFDRNKRRALHLMQMLRLLEEDVDRFAFQILRQASRIEVPIESISDLYFIVLTTSLLESISDSIFGTVRDICKIYGIDHNRLSFPTDVLLGEIKVSPIRVSEDLENIRKLYSSQFEMCRKYLQKIRSFMLADGSEKAYTTKEELVKLRDDLGNLLSNAVNDLLAKKSKSEIESNIAEILRIGYRIADIITKMEELAKLSVTFYFPKASEKEEVDR